jgi:peptidoglycan/xylan/chitin deacetylase (PgdA/CDA1 family)
VIRQDLQRSRETLLAELGKDALHLAFPGGCYDGPSLAAVAEAGYRFAYTICAHRDASWPTLTIPRRMLWQGSCVDSARRFSEAVLSCQLNGVFDAATSCRNRHALRRADPPA